MLQRLYQQWSLRISAAPGRTIPLQLLAHASVSGVMLVTARWASVLVTATVAGVIWWGLPPQTLLMIAPTAWADRTLFTYLRLRHL